MDDYFGTEFWSYDRLSSPQRDVAAALTVEWLPLREVLHRGTLDARPQRSYDGRVAWDRLISLDIMCIDRSRKDGVYVARGEAWGAWWSSEGWDVTGLQALGHGLPLDELI